MMEIATKLAFLLILGGSFAYTCATDRPIIGIIAQETSSGYGDTFIPMSYVRFLMMGGARVVAIKLMESDTYYQDLFSKINGLLIPGGQNSATTSEFARVANLMLNLSMQANGQGDYFPVLGICLGYQIMTNYIAGRNRLYSTPGMMDVSLPVNFTQAAYTSRIMANAPSDIFSALQNNPVSYHSHNYGIHLWKFNSQQELMDFFTVVATNMDSDNKEVASLVEAKAPNMPIFGCQWHPEKNCFVWDPTKNIDHSLPGIQAAQYLANFFVQETLKNDHSFPTVAEEGTSLIQTEHIRYFTGGKFQENVYINYE